MNDVIRVPIQPAVNPPLLDVPRRIETSRLILRAFEPGDGPLVTQSVRESLPELKRWMPWAIDSYGFAEGESWVRKAVAEFHLRTQLQYFIMIRDAEEHVGNVGLFAFAWNVPRGEVGYWLRTSQRGKGFMTEAVDALGRMAFDALKLIRLELRCDDENVRSAAVAKRSGYGLEGVLRNHERRADGTIRHTRIYARTVPAQV